MPRPSTPAPILPRDRGFVDKVFILRVCLPKFNLANINKILLYRPYTKNE